MRRRSVASRKEAQQEGADHGSRKAIDAAEEDDDDLLDGRGPAEELGLHVVDEKGRQATGEPGQSGSEYEDDHLGGIDIDAHGLRGQLVVANGYRGAA